MISEGKFEMSELHIIGNGFDKGHGLKTSYWNFREYLEKYEEDFLFQMERMYNFAPFERKDNRNRKNKQRQTQLILPLLYFRKRQIITRSDIKLLQLFASWSNSL